MTVHRTRLHHRIRPRRTVAHPTARDDRGRARAGLGRRLLARLAAEQGDVPGWVLITFMTGVRTLVASLLFTAGKHAPRVAMMRPAATLGCLPA